MTDIKIGTDSSPGESDPGAWLDPGSQALGRALIAAGRDERPSASALGRTLVAVGVAATTLTLAGEGAALSSLASGGAAGGSVAGGAAVGSGAVGGAAVGSGVVGGAAVGGSAAVATGTVLKSATAALVVKWLAGGVVVGATAFGVAEVVSTAELSAPNSAVVAVDPAGAKPAAVAEAEEGAAVRSRAGSDAVALPAAPAEALPQEAVGAEPVAAKANEAAHDSRSALPTNAEQGAAKSEAPKAEPAALLRGSSLPGSPAVNKEEEGWVTGKVPLPERSAVDDSKLTAEADAEVPSELRAELRRVDQARALLDAGRAVAALAELRLYRQEFPAGRLSPEALFLEMQAQHQLGRTEEARAAARRIVERYPAGPHAGRAREILEQ